MSGRFFGYGSLVNRRTHESDNVRRDEVTGWQRTWRRAAARPVSFLTVERAPGVTLRGLSAAVPNGDWTALDLREASYLRAEAFPGTAIYHLPPGTSAAPSKAHPVILSYIDVVVEGYMAEFGEDGVAHFFDTTTGWDAPILNDRAHPRYTRTRDVGVKVRGIVDRKLMGLGCHIFAEGMSGE